MDVGPKRDLVGQYSVYTGGLYRGLAQGVDRVGNTWVWSRCSLQGFDMCSVELFYTHDTGVGTGILGSVRRLSTAVNMVKYMRSVQRFGTRFFQNVVHAGTTRKA